MTDLLFDQAYELLRSTMPDAEFQGVEKHGGTDRYGLPTGTKVATVTCYEPRLNTCIRKIGGWTFFINNRFVSYHVRTIAAMWLFHKGGTKYGELELMRSLRYCFKRFYAECLVSLGTPPIGRALLFESIIFERRFIHELLQHVAVPVSSEIDQFNRSSFEAAQHGTTIGQRHEMAHYLLSVPGENLLDNAAKLFDGTVVPFLETLLNEGNNSLAEEIFCDAFALNSIIRTEEEYKEIDRDAGSLFYSALHLDEVRSAYFCYNVLMRLSQIWFQASKDAKKGWDAAEHKTQPNENSQLPLESQSRERLSFLSMIVEEYVGSRTGNIHGREAKFYFAPQFDQLIATAASNVTQTSEVDDLSAISEPEREIARFLSSTTWLSTETNRFMIDFARERELEGWVRHDELFASEGEQEATIDFDVQTNPDAPEKIMGAGAFSDAMQIFYESYMKVFDSILVDIALNNGPEPGTFARHQAFTKDLFEQIERFGIDIVDYQTGPLKPYVIETRNLYSRLILEMTVIILTLMRKGALDYDEAIVALPVKQRLKCIEDYARRNNGQDTVAITTILLPELKAKP